MRIPIARALAISTTLFTVFALFAPASASAGPALCIPANSKAVFNVTFSAAFENSIRLVRQDTREVLRSFNNYYKRGAGPEWHQGAGGFATGYYGKKVCLDVIGMHKNSGPNAAMPWNISKARVNSSNPPHIGFEDSTDNDFSDAVITARFITRHVETGFRSNTFCAPGGARLTFTAAFSATYENALRILDKPTGRTLHSFNNYYGKGAGPMWQQGPGSWRYTVEGASRCFLVTGFHKEGKPDPKLPWRRSSFQPGGNIISFEDGTNNDYNDATIRVTVEQ